MSDEPDNPDKHDATHQRSMRAHRKRSFTAWVPYAQRPCELPLRYTDDGEGHVTCQMAVLGLGSLTITVDAPLACVLKPRHVWEVATVAVRLSAKGMDV